VGLRALCRARPANSAVQGITGVRLCNSAHSALGVLVMIAKLRTLSPARERHVPKARPVTGPPISNLNAISHRSEIGPDVDGVGGEQKHDDGLQPPARLVPTDVAGKTATGHPSDPGVLLDCNHQGIGKDHGPRGTKAELCARLAISPDPDKSFGNQARS
jgi:hypothetical protein